MRSVKTATFVLLAASLGAVGWAAYRAGSITGRRSLDWIGLILTSRFMSACGCHSAPILEALYTTMSGSESPVDTLL